MYIFKWDPAAAEVQDACSVAAFHVFLEKNTIHSREWDCALYRGGGVHSNRERASPVSHGSRLGSVMSCAVQMIRQLNTRTPTTRGGDQGLQEGEGSEKGEGKKCPDTRAKYVLSLGGMSGGF
uniref:Uncharacterized protein n=1 Tax=Felis catus TaxID=9685 RepID=A0ABI7WN35_FELCA